MTETEFMPQSPEDRSGWQRLFAVFIASQTVSLLGSSLVQYAILWYITLETNSGLMMALSIIFGFLPTFFLSPFAGVWADRFDRKKLIMLSDLGIALATLVLFTVFRLGYHGIWLLFLISAIRSVGTAIQSPAVSAFLPQIVPEGKLMRANGLLASFQSAIALVSPIVSGALMSLWAIEFIFLIDVVTCILAVLFLLTLKVAPHAKALEKQAISYWQDLRLGFAYIRGHRLVRSLFQFFALFFVLVSPAAFLTPLQVARSFGEDVWRLTAIEVAFSSGMLLGGLVMSVWGGFKNRIHSMILSIYLIGINQILLGGVPWFWIYVAVMVVVGVTLPIFNTPAMTLLQEKVEDAYLGRVFGVLSMISSGFMPLAILVFGPLADRVSIEWQLIATGILLVIQGVFLQKNKLLIQEGQPTSAADQAKAVDSVR
ncbi:MAG: MFS transporter [Clostridia bacterium]|nr:MFS transporter [Clostridia bacterium]